MRSLDRNMEGAHLADLSAPSDKLSEESHALALLAWSPAPVASPSVRYATQALAQHTCLSSRGHSEFETFKRCVCSVSPAHFKQAAAARTKSDCDSGPALLLSFIAEVNSVRTNLSPFTKGYRGLASRMQFDPIYERRASLSRGALTIVVDCDLNIS